MTDQPTILIVDDVPENLSLLETIITERGFQVRVAPNGALALRAVRTRPPDLILLDVNMPAMTGFEVCERLKADATTEDIPVIFLTARSDTVDRVRGFRVGAADYVTKPFSAEEVCARVETHLALRRTQQELEREKKVIEEQMQDLQRLERAREDLTHMIVHDMRTPLGAMRLFIDALLWIDDPQEHTDVVNELASSASRLERMIENVLDTARLENEKPDLEITACELHRIVTMSANTTLGMLGHRVDIAVDIPRDIPVWADRDLIQRVLENLLVNAAKHSPAGGIVKVTAERREGSTTFAIVDQGPGVSSETAEQIFERYHRGESNERNWGLGLSFCKLVVDAHGGDIGVENVAGAGARFSIRLPDRARELEAWTDEGLTLGT